MGDISDKVRREAYEEARSPSSSPINPRDEPLIVERWYPVEWLAWLHCGPQTLPVHRYGPQTFPAHRIGPQTLPGHRHGPQTLPAHRQCENDRNIGDALIRGTEKNHTGTAEQEKKEIVEATDIGDVEFRQILLQLKYSKTEKAIVSNYIFIVLQFGIFTSYFSQLKVPYFLKVSLIFTLTVCIFIELSYIYFRQERID